MFATEMDDEARAKLKELQVHVPFLKRVIERMKTPKVPIDECANHMQHTKMVSLYNLLTTGAKRLNLKTLQKCENVLIQLHNTFDKTEIISQSQPAKLAKEKPLASIDLTGPESPPPNELQCLVGLSELEPVEIPTERRESPISSEEVQVATSSNCRQWSVKATSKYCDGDKDFTRGIDRWGTNLRLAGFAAHEHNSDNHVAKNIKPRNIFVNDKYHYQRRQPQQSPSNPQHNPPNHSLNNEIPGAPTLAEVREKLTKIVNISTERKSPVATSTGCSNRQNNISSPVIEKSLGILSPPHPRAEIMPKQHQRYNQHQQQHQQHYQKQQQHHFQKQKQQQHHQKQNNQLQHHHQKQKQNQQQHHQQHHQQSQPHQQQLQHHQPQHQHQQQEQQQQQQQHNWNNQNVRPTTASNMNVLPTFIPSDPRLRKTQMHSDQPNTLNMLNVPSLSPNQGQFLANGQLQQMLPKNNNLQLPKSSPYQGNNNTIEPIIPLALPMQPGRSYFRRETLDVHIARKDPRLAPDARFGNYGRLQVNTIPNRATELKHQLQQLKLQQQQQQQFHHQQQQQSQRQHYQQQQQQQQHQQQQHCTNFQQMHEQNPTLLSQDMVWQRRNSWQNNSEVGRLNYNTLLPGSTRFKTVQNDIVEPSKHYEAGGSNASTPRTYAEFKRAKARTADKDDRAKPKNETSSSIGEDVSKSAKELPQLDKLYRSTNINLTFPRPQALSFKIPKKVQIDAEKAENSDIENTQNKVKHCEDNIVEDIPSKTKAHQSKHQKNTNKKTKKIKNTESNSHHKKLNEKKLSKTESEANMAADEAIVNQNKDENDRLSSPSAANMETLEIEVVNRDRPEKPSIKKGPKRKITLNQQQINSKNDVQKQENQCQESETSNNSNKNELNKIDRQKRTEEKRIQPEEKSNDNALEIPSTTTIPLKIEAIKEEKESKSSKEDGLKNVKSGEASESPSRRTLRESISTAVELFESNNAAMVVIENTELQPEKTQLPCISHRRSTMVEFTSFPLINKRKVLEKINKEYEDAHVLQVTDEGDAEGSEERRYAKRNKSLAEIFEKTDDNCRVSTQNILTGKRRTRNSILLNETELIKAAYRQSKSKNLETPVVAVTSKENLSLTKPVKSGSDAIAKLSKEAKLTDNKSEAPSDIITTNLAKKSGQKRCLKKQLNVDDETERDEEYVVDHSTVHNEDHLNAKTIQTSTISSSIAPPVINMLRNFLPPEKLELVISMLGDPSNISSENTAKSNSSTGSTFTNIHESTASKKETGFDAKDVVTPGEMKSSTSTNTSSNCAQSIIPTHTIPVTATSETIPPDTGNVSKEMPTSKSKKPIINVTDDKDKERDNVTLKRKRRPNRTELDNLTSDLCNVNVDLPAGGRRSYAVGAGSDKKYRYTRSRSNSGSIGAGKNKTSEKRVRFINSARRGRLFGRVWRSYRKLDSYEFDALDGNDSDASFGNSSNKAAPQDLRHCVVKLKKLKSFVQKHKIRKSLETQDGKLKITTKLASDEELNMKLTTEISSSDALIIKNTNPTWHSMWNNTKGCVVCSKKHSIENFVQMHGEYYFSRMLPSILAELREGKLNKPTHKTVDKQIKYFHRCSFCLQSDRLIASNWVEHYGKHMGYFKYLCSKCNLPKQKLKDLEKHLEQCGPEAKIISKDKVTFTTDLKAHVCHLCNYIQFLREDLDRHYKKQHDIPVDKVKKLGYAVTLLTIDNDVPKLSKSCALEMEKKSDQLFKRKALLIEKIEGISLSREKKMDDAVDDLLDAADVRSFSVENFEVNTNVQTENQIDFAETEIITENDCGVGDFLRADDTYVGEKEETTTVISPNICAAVEPEVFDSERDYEQLQDEILRLAEEAEAAEPPTHNGLISVINENTTDDVDMPLSDFTNSNFGSVEYSDGTMSQSETTLIDDQQSAGARKKIIREEDWEDVDINAQRRLQYSNQKGKKNIFKKLNKLLTVISSNKSRNTSLSPSDKISTIELDVPTLTPAIPVDVRKEIQPITISFPPLINTLDAYVSGSECNDNPVQLVPQLTSLEPLLFDNVSERSDNNNTKKVVCNVGCASHGEKQKFYCMIDGCTFLFSNEVIGLENHFKREHPNAAWTGYCRSCAVNVNGGHGNFLLCEEIQHMLKAHIEEVQKQLENNVSLNNQKIKVRRFTGDRISNMAAEESPTTSEAPVTEIPITVSDYNFNGKNADDANKRLSITAVSSGAPAASVIAEFAKREKQIKLTDLPSSLRILNVISLGEIALSQNTTMTPTPSCPQQKQDEIDLVNVASCEDQHRHTASPEPFIVSEQFVAQETNGDFIITQTVSAKYEEKTPTSAPQVGFSISLTPTLNNTGSALTALPVPITGSSAQMGSISSESIDSRASQLPVGGSFRCMENNCNFKTMLTNAMRDHLLFHQRQNFSQKPDYLQCAQCAHQADDVDGYLKHSLEMHKTTHTILRKDNGIGDTVDVTQKIRNIFQENKSRSSGGGSQSEIQNRLQVSVVQALVDHTGIREDKLFKCPVKGCFVELTEATFNNHVVFHKSNSQMAGNDIFSLQCPHCAKVLLKPSSLKQHIRRHAQHKYFCFYCLFTSASPNGMRKHLMEKHSAPLNDIIDSEIAFASPTIVKTKFYVTATSKLSQAQECEFGYRLINELAKRRPSIQRFFMPNEMDLLPKEMIFTHTIFCEQCQYGTKVRANMLRHMQQHKSQASIQLGLGQLASNDPVNPVPCLATNQRFFDKMTNLASSSLVTPQSTVVSSTSTPAPAEMSTTSTTMSTAMATTTTTTTTTSTATHSDVSKNDDNTMTTISNITDKSAASAQMPNYIYVPELKRFVCGVIDCNYAILSEEAFRAHLSLKHNAGVAYVCPFCAEEMRLEVNRAIRHLRFHDKHLYRCSGCEFLHYYKVAAERHLSERHAGNPSVHLLRYVREQAGELTGEIVQPYSSVAVGKVNKATGSVGEVAAAVNTRNPKSIWECQLCHHHASTYNQMLSHCKTEHDSSHRYRCRYCIFASNSVKEVQAHMEQLHTSLVQQPVIVYEKIPINTTSVLPRPTTPPPMLMPTTSVYTTIPKPLWSRNDPQRKRTIRGILMEEEPPKKKSAPNYRRLAVPDTTALLSAGGNMDDATLTVVPPTDLQPGGDTSLIQHMEYVCGHCDYQTSNFDYLRTTHWPNEHFKSDLEARPFFYRLQPHMRCAVCLTFVGNSRDVQQHLICNHKLSNLLCTDVQSQMECPYCHFSYETVQELAHHMLRVQHNPHDLKRLTDEQLDAVLKLGESGKYFQCTLCTIILPSEKSVVRHCYASHANTQGFSFRSLSNVLVYHCAICFIASKDELDMLRHMLTHYDRFKRCEFCSVPIAEGFINYAQHFYAKHRNALENFTNLHSYADLKKFLSGSLLYQFPNGLIINKQNLEHTKYGQDDVISKLYKELGEIAAKPPIPRLSMAELLSRKCNEAAAKAQQQQQVSSQQQLQSYQSRLPVFQSPTRTTMTTTKATPTATVTTTATIHNTNSQAHPPILLRISKRRHTVAVQHNPLFLTTSTTHCDVRQAKKNRKSAAEC